MPGVLFEQKNSAAPSYPYIDSVRRNLSNPPHYHTETEIVVVISGSVTVYCASGNIITEEGDIAVIMPGEIHSYSSETENKVYVIKLYCKNTTEDIELWKYRFSGNILKHGTELNEKLRRHIDDMVREDRSNTLGASFAVNSHANMIISLILRSKYCEKQDSDARRRNEATLDLLEKVKNYIKHHFSDQITLEAIAAHCNMSKFYFAHTFKEAMGVTFFDYLNSIRIDTAMRFLVDTDKSVTEVSHRSGFSNTRMFNRIFKAKLGVSPRDYRKRFRQ